MNYLKMLGPAAVLAMALMAVSAGSASATTLAKGNTVQGAPVIVSFSAESSITLSDTEGFQANTCSVSSATWITSVAHGEKITGSLSELSFKTCTRSPVTVDANGSLYVIHEASTPSGNVYSEGASVTVPTTFGFSVTCTTLASGTKIGTMVGSASGNATVAIFTVLSCGFLLPSASWSGNYKVTSPTGLNVIA